jgi:hypothetical protein
MEDTGSYFSRRRLALMVNNQIPRETLLPEMAPLAAIAPNGNGSANGNGVVLTSARN